MDGGAGRQAGERRRRRARRGTQWNLRDETSLDSAGSEEERSREAEKSRRTEEDG